MGDLVLKGATSGQITLTPTAIAGTNTLTLPATTGTLITSSSPTITTPTITTPTIATIQSASVGTPTQFNDSGGTQVGTLCRAWVQFVGASGAVNASFNVSSVTRASTGNYTANFTNALTDNKYAVAATTSSWAVAYTTLTTTACGLNTYNTTTGAALDTASTGLAIFR